MNNKQPTTFTRNTFSLTILFVLGIALFTSSNIRANSGFALSDRWTTTEMIHIKAVHPAAYFWWGQIGHRATGWIALDLLNSEARQADERMLDGNSLAEVSTWIDEVRADPSFDYMSPRHYITMPPGKTYKTAVKAEGGDALWVLDKMVSELKEGKPSSDQEAINLKVLVHLIGDLHQPLHVGNGTDRGGK